jgi:hypothetical protein
MRQTAARNVVNIMLLLTVATFSPASGADSTSEIVTACRAIALDANATAEKVTFPMTFDTGRCWGAFAVVQQAATHGDNNKRSLYGICAPPESTRLQLVRLVYDYSERNPQRREERFFDVALDALRGTFPCPSRP